MMLLGPLFGGRGEPCLKSPSREPPLIPDGGGGVGVELPSEEGRFREDWDAAAELLCFFDLKRNAIVHCAWN